MIGAAVGIHGTVGVLRFYKALNRCRGEDLIGAAVGSHGTVEVLRLYKALNCRENGAEERT